MGFDSVVFKKGLKDGLPIGISYVPMAMAVSIMAQKLGIPFGIWELMSGLIYSGSSQSAILNLISCGANVLSIYVLIFSVITCRHILFSLSLAQKIDPKTSILTKLLFAPFNTDEIYVVSMQQKGLITGSYLFGIIIPPYLGQMFGITLGFLFTTLLPDCVRSAFGITLYAVFLSLIVPPMRKSRSVLVAVACAAALNILLECIPAVKNILPPGIPMLITTFITCIIGALFLPVEEEEKKAEDEIEKNNI